MIQRVTRLTVGLTLVLQTGAALAEDGPCLPNPDRPGPPELCIESVELDTTRLTPDGNGYLDRAGVHVALLVRGSQPHHARGGDYKLVVALTAAGPDGVLFDADLVEEAIERGAGPPGAHLRRINLEFSPLAGPTRAPLGDYTLTVHADLLRSEQRRDRLVDSDAANAGVVTLLDFPAETDLLLERAAIDDLIGRRSPAPFDPNLLVCTNLTQSYASTRAICLDNGWTGNHVTNANPIEYDLDAAPESLIPFGWAHEMGHVLHRRWMCFPNSPSVARCPSGHSWDANRVQFPKCMLIT